MLLYILINIYDLTIRSIKVVIREQLYRKILKYIKIINFIPVYNKIRFKFVDGNKYFKHRKYLKFIINNENCYIIMFITINNC